MSGVLSDRRNMIPRWGLFDSQAHNGESGATGNIPKPLQRKQDKEELKSLLKVWNTSRGIDAAIELVNASIVFNLRPEAEEAASFLLNSGQLSSHLKFAAESIISPDLDEGTSSHISDQLVFVHQTRSLLRKHPRNPILWADLAYHYASVGSSKKAQRAINTAVSLHPNNRFIVRSAARFYIHDDDVQQALNLLRSSVLLKTDPWVMAAEIAVSEIAEKNAVSTKRGLKLLSCNGRFHDYDISELASSIATKELMNGAHKKSSKLFKQGLSKPTENSLAQAVWASSKLNIRLDADQYSYLANAYEAQTMKESKNGNWEVALELGTKWEKQESFSSRPFVHNSFVSSVALGKPDLTAAHAKRGLIANPDDPQLLNNLAVGLAQQGLIEDAKKAIKKARLSSFDDRDITIAATEAMIAYRAGDITLGREKYEWAVKQSKASNSKGLFSLALLHWIQEEQRYTNEDMTPILSKIKSQIDEKTMPELITMTNRLSRKPKADELDVSVANNPNFAHVSYKDFIKHLPIMDK